MKKILFVFISIIYLFYSQLAFSQNQNIIYVYNDAGVSEESLIQSLSTFTNLVNKKYTIKTIDATEVKQGKWIPNAALFILPGGADVPYTKKLNGLGNQQIKKYVNNGGAFLGICAGAYYAASYVEFDKKGPLKVLGDRELKFFDGKAIGPILAPYDYKTQSGSRAAEISTIFTKVPKTVVFYNGGGFFENAEKFSNTKIIANYNNNLPAIIFIKYGKGKAVLSGVHFEYNPASLDREDAYIKQIIYQLNKFNTSRKVLLEQLLNILEVCSL
jgi:biotin--protein ligase